MKRLAFTLLIIILVGSCDKPEDDELESEINGKWSMKTVHGQVDFSDTDLGGNTVTFDIVSKSATFESPKGLEFIRESGKYAYSYRDGLLSFGTDRFYRYQLNGDQLILTYVDDELIIDDEAAFIYQRETETAP